jgi:YHS domain-containing protein
MKTMAQMGLVALLAMVLVAAVGCSEKQAPAPSDKPAAKASEGTSPAVEKVTYTCPMHPDVKRDAPGKCPKCGMDLVPEKKAGAAAMPAMPAPTAAETAGIAQKLCPVTGDPINPSLFVEYNGRKIYFCCAACPPKFNADPEKYIKIVDEQLKAAAASVK